MIESDQPIWNPSAERAASAQITRFMQWLASTKKLQFGDYESLWMWSVENLSDFWAAAWEYFDVIARRPYDVVMSDEDMPFTRWFEGCELNYVEQIFRHRTLPGPALIYDGESGPRGEMSWPELERQVATLAHTLRTLGVTRGDRVVGYLPNIPQAVVGFLATASIGAVWSISAPDMGPLSVRDRFKQITPRVMIACDGYVFAGRRYDRREPLRAIIRDLPSLESIVWVGHLDRGEGSQEALEGYRTLNWEQATAGNVPLEVDAVSASHPLWILYSSGTTGMPKAIVHGHGGMVVNGLLGVRIHMDVAAGDRVFWSSSTSWMVWNAHVSALLTGATLVLYDGAPTGRVTNRPDWTHLWRLADQEQVSCFGAGAAFFHSCLKAGVVPRELGNLARLKTIASTGSPLSSDGYRWLASAVKKDVWINSTSGGTDICGAFVGGVPTLPVYSGEMQRRGDAVCTAQLRRAHRSATDGGAIHGRFALWRQGGDESAAKEALTQTSSAVNDRAHWFDSV